MTPRGMGMSVAVALLWVAARTFGIPELQMAAVGGLVLIVSAVLWAALLPTRLTADRVVSPGTLWFDGQATVRLTITNRGRFRSPRLLVEDGVPAGLATASSSRLPRIASGERTTITYRIRGTQRGRFTLGPLVARAQDPFGLVARVRTIDPRDTITVYPPIWKLPPGLPLGGSTSTGRDRRRTVPSGDDLADIREYVRGDDLRSVHWPSTAHRGRLMVRRSESSRSPGAVVVLDRRIDGHAGTGPGASFETAVAAAASAGYHLWSRGHVVTLLAEPVTHEPQPTPWDVWLEDLAVATPGRVDLDGLLRQIGDGIAGDGTLIVIVTTPGPTELLALVRAGRNFTTRVALIVDASSHLGRDSDPGVTGAVGSLRAAGWRAAGLQRGTRIDDVWREVLAGGRRGHAGATAAGSATPATEAR